MRTWIRYGWMMLLALSCTEPFDPPVTDQEVNILVVDGFLNATSKTITVKLNYARPLASTEPYTPEQQARVFLEPDIGAGIQLAQTQPGVYKLEQLQTNINNSYRLRITLNNGKEYASEPVRVLRTPPIDSVTWRATDTGVNILVNAHDDTNQTRFYQWNFVETWQYNAPQFSSYILENGFVRLREPSEQLFTCWNEQPSTSIIVHNTTRLVADVVRDFSVNFIPAGSEKISNKYSILVQQHAISREAHDFWNQLKQTTENLGGLFDPQPGRIFGNMRCLTDPDEPVLGYFQAAEVTEQRMYLTFLELPRELRNTGFNESCRPDSVSVENVSRINPQIYHLVNAVYEGLSIVGYTYTRHPCADCRFQGGTLTKPAWWE
jgi:hypothetical protein